jgi:hypothetical protein
LFRIGMHAAVVELHPLLTVVRSAVRVIVAARLSGWSEMSRKTKRNIHEANPMKQLTRQCDWKPRTVDICCFDP